MRKVKQRETACFNAIQEGRKGVNIEAFTLNDSLICD